MVNNNDVAVPPTTSAYGQIDETNLESVSAHRLALLRKEQERVRWMNSPNAYQKVEFLEYGADNPKKITKVRTVFNFCSTKIKFVHELLMVCVIMFTQLFSYKCTKKFEETLN